MHAEKGNQDHGIMGPTERPDRAASWKRTIGKMKVGSPFRIVFYKDTALTLWMAASAYANYYCIQVSNPPVYKDIYHFNELEIGLAYLPGGAGVVLAAYANGKLMDRNYAITAKDIGHEIDRVTGDDLDIFPIERARVRLCWILLSISSCGWIGYGWALENSVHVSVPLILQFMHGFLCTCVLQTFNALLVDTFPKDPSAAAMSGNITRCALSALYVALLQPLVKAIGRGWYFTLLGISSGLAGGLAVVPHSKSADGSIGVPLSDVMTLNVLFYEVLERKKDRTLNGRSMCSVIYRQLSVEQCDAYVRCYSAQLRFCHML